MTLFPKARFLLPATLVGVFSLAVAVAQEQPTPSESSRTSLAKTTENSPNSTSSDLTKQIGEDLSINATAAERPNRETDVEVLGSGANPSVSFQPNKEEANKPIGDDKPEETKQREAGRGQDEAIWNAELAEKSNRIVEEAEVYLYGDGKPTDLAKAAELYTQAAALGNPKAMVRLSTMYRRGIGLEKNETRAFSLVKEAAELGYAPAQASLGIFYRDGMGTAVNHERYRHWTKQAAEKGHIMAMILESNALEEDKDDPEAIEKSLQYIERVKLLASPQEIYSIAYSYHHGLRLPQDDQKAIHWAQEGANKGEVNAMYLLGELRWTERNFPEAASWFEKAAEKGLPAAQLQTGRIYRTGEEGVKANPEKAVKWLSLAAAHADKEDLLSLLVLLKTGPKSVQDPQKAQKWLELYLPLANPDELQEVADKYWKGMGGRKDYELAGAFALASLQKGDHRYLCDFAAKLGTPNWKKSDFIIAYSLLNGCVLDAPDDEDIQRQFSSLEQRMSAQDLQEAQQLESEDALEQLLHHHKVSIE